MELQENKGNLVSDSLLLYMKYSWRMQQYASLQRECGEFAE